MEKKKIMLLLLIIAALALIIYGIGKEKQSGPVTGEMKNRLPQNPNQELEFDLSNLREIVLAGGCFWGIEAYMARVPGVYSAVSGYANGDPAYQEVSYQEVCTGRTGFTEAVKILYDPALLPLPQLLQQFFLTFDPTQQNRQGNDIGSQYRSGIYYSDEADLPVIENIIALEQEKYKKTIASEVEELTIFIAAEEYHQKYLEKNPGGYCHVSFDSLPDSLLISPDLAKGFGEKLEPEAKDSADQADEPVFTRPDDKTIKKDLSPLQFYVTQKKGTEPPYQNEYDNEFKPGIYVDIVTGEPLFLSTDKYDSGCGWPAFTRPIAEELLLELEDNSLGMRRVEVVSKLGNSHLGHLFTDGPKDRGGLRYCINSAALSFIPQEEMAEKGYGKWLALLDEKNED